MKWKSTLVPAIFFSIGLACSCPYLDAGEDDGVYVIREPQRSLEDIDRFHAEIPAVTYEPPADRWERLPRTRKILAEGWTLRIVQLGDSIVNDTARSGWTALLERRYQRSRVIATTCVRGSTGCWWYKEGDRVEKYVLDHAPDLVVIGGISQREDIDSIRSVIEKIRRSSPADILLLSGAFGDVDPRDDRKWAFAVDPAGNDYRARLARLASEMGTAFLDLHAHWGKYIRSSGRELAWFKRDPVHANERGEQILGRILERHFAPRPSDAPPGEALRPPGAWWLEKPMRLIQTNLREIDATLDLESYVGQIKDVAANVVLFNVGGIVANYPTEIPCHYRNPNLKDDLVGKVVERLHAEGIRVIGRFDFSKINEKIAALHPEWLYVSEKGGTVTYNGQVHACINGGYQQERLFDILREALDRYPLDGVFFNMIGYVTSDYSGNYHGFCQCKACAERFKKHCGMDLPKSGSSGVAREAYDRFRQETTEDLFRKVREFIRSRREGVAVCTYTPAGVDIVRTESNEDLGRWVYSASDNVKSVLGSWRDKVSSNASVHFPAYPIRHASVSPHLTGLRLAQDLFHGGWLDHYVIGRLETQEDRASLRRVRDIFRFHRDHEAWFARTRSAARVLLVRGDGTEYRGFFRILSEAHIPFDSMEAGLILAPEAPRPLEDHALVILPDVPHLDERALAGLTGYIRGGGKVLLSGRSGLSETGTGAGRTSLLDVAGIRSVRKIRPPEPGTYFRIRAEDKARLGEKTFEDIDIVYLEGELLECQPAEGTEAFLGFIPAAMFGPPEKCYYREVTQTPGLLLRTSGPGACACFPWGIGRHYERRSHHGHGLLIRTAIEKLLGLERRIIVDASPLLEVGHRVAENGAFEWVGLINLSGQNGTVFHEPIPLRDVRVRLRPLGKVKGARLLHAGRTIDLALAEGGWVEAAVPEFNDYEVLLVEYDP